MLASISNVMLNRCGHACLTPDLEREVFSLSLLNMVFAVGVFLYIYIYMAFIMLRTFPSILSLLSVEFYLILFLHQLR